MHIRVTVEMIDEQIAALQALRGKLGRVHPTSDRLLLLDLNRSGKLQCIGIGPVDKDMHWSRLSLSVANKRRFLDNDQKQAHGDNS